MLTLRQKFNMNVTPGEGFSLLLHGGYAAGKTYLVGDALKYESSFGPVRFLNTAGEDGFQSASTHELGEVGETVDTYEDAVSVLKEWREMKLQALGIDSLKLLSRFSMYHTLKEHRLPMGGGKTNEWGPVHFEMEGLASSLRSVAKFVLVTCPSDKSVNQLTGNTLITPDLMGKQAAGIAHWFDFVAYLRATAVGPKKIKREFIIKPDESILTRQRLAKAIADDIILPEGPGGWKMIKQAMGVKEK